MNKSLEHKRILVCGKGGSGKSSIAALMGMALEKIGYSVIILDGDASNPGGLTRLLFGNKENPKPLFDFFGGREFVDCPVDDPKPLTRLNEDIPIANKNIDITEIPDDYYIRQDGIQLLQVGKIQDAFEGCDGPMSKVTRDFIVKGDYVTLLDVEAGIEHFGRGLEQYVDIIIVIIDPTYESFFVAQKVSLMAQQMNVNENWAILNKARNSEIEQKMRTEAQDRGINLIASINYDPEVELAGLTGSKLEQSEAFDDVLKMIQNLEEKYLKKSTNN